MFILRFLLIGFLYRRTLRGLRREVRLQRLRLELQEIDFKRANIERDMVRRSAAG